MTRLWQRAKRRGLARWLRDFAMLRVIAWLLLLPAALKYGWASSVTFVTVLSLLALVLSDLAVYQAGRGEVASLENP